jgi:hypothetical protein
MNKGAFSWQIGRLLVEKSQKIGLFGGRLDFGIFHLGIQWKTRSKSHFLGFATSFQWIQR